MEIQNLDRIAWEYLMGSGRDDPPPNGILINASGSAIFPLLRAGLRVAREFSPLGVTDRKTAEFLWINQMAKPMMDSIYALVQVIRQPAYDALCRALWEQDVQFKVLASLILLLEPNHSLRTIRWIKDAFNWMKLNDLNGKWFWRSRTLDRLNCTLDILNYILARGGVHEHQQSLKEIMTKFQQGEVEDAVRNRGLVYLMR